MSDEFLSLQSLPAGHLSVYRITTWLRCRLQFYYRYLDKIPWTMPAKVLLGSAYHSGVEYGYKWKADAHENWPKKDIHDVYATAFEAKKGKVAMDWEGQEAGAVKDEGYRLLDTYAPIGSQTQPKDARSVERRLEVQVEGVKILGYMDLQDSGNTIIDHKVKRAKTSPEAVASDLQLGVYEVALQEAGDPVAGRALHTAIRYKRGPQVDVVPAPALDAVGTRTIKDIVRGVALDMRTGNFFPSGYPGACSWCSYGPKQANICPAWKATASSVPQQAGISY